MVFMQTGSALKSPYYTQNSPLHPGYDGLFASLLIMFNHDSKNEIFPQELGWDYLSLQYAPVSDNVSLKVALPGYIGIEGESTRELA
jgi:hypothetical protein